MDIKWQVSDNKESEEIHFEIAHKYYHYEVYSIVGPDNIKKWKYAILLSKDLDSPKSAVFETKEEAKKEVVKQLYKRISKIKFDILTALEALNRLLK